MEREIVLYLQMRYIVETQGQPPDHLLDKALKTGCFFLREYPSGCWKLKTPEFYQQETGIQSKETRRVKFRSLDDVMNVSVLFHHLL